ncbi:MAG: glycosyltransferase family 39 protein [Flavobacteriales bacterium]|nr:MAG: glycosyltransferase family 39 protein [Flavobacteriales bacterium]
MPLFSTIKNFFSPDRRWPWLLLALALKLGGVVFFLIYNRAEAGSRHIALEHGDTFSYLDPIDNLLSTGHYTPDLRMPGYGAVYLLFRLVVEPIIARDLVVLLQMVLAAVAVYVGARLAQRLTGRNAAFVIVFFLLGISPYMSTLESRLCTESFCTSALIFACWLLLRWRDEGRKRWLLLAGALVGWAIFLRPITGVALLALAPMAYVSTAPTLLKRWWPVVLFLLPFGVADGIWTARNYVVNQAFHPLTNGLYYTNASGRVYWACVDLVRLYGGHSMWWDDRSHVAWFNAYDVGTGLPKNTNGLPPPDWFHTPEFNLDSLKDLSARTYHVQESAMDSAERETLTLATVARYRRYVDSAREHFPLRTTIGGRAMNTWNFFWQYGSAGLFFKPWAESSLPAKAMKAYQGAVYLVAIFLGTAAGLLRLFDRRSSMPLRSVGALAVVGVLMIPLLFQLTEYRYSVPSFPFLLILALDQLYRWKASLRT